MCHLEQFWSIEATSAAHEGRDEPGGGWYTSTPQTIVGRSFMRPRPWRPFLSAAITLPPPSFRLTLSSSPAWYCGSVAIGRLPAILEALQHCTGTPVVASAHRLTAS